jgi:hypothetical protein
VYHTERTALQLQKQEVDIGADKDVERRFGHIVPAPGDGVEADIHKTAAASLAHDQLGGSVSVVLVQVE